MANFSFIDTTEDLEWLHDVHGIDVSEAVAAEIHGNEDCPERVCVYRYNDYREQPAVWERNNDGRLICIVGPLDRKDS